MDDDIPSLVFDFGSFNIRAGFAGDDEPRYWEQKTHEDMSYDLDPLIRDIISGLRAPLSEHDILFIEPLYSPFEGCDTAIELLFEEFKVPSLCAQNAHVMSLISTGRTTGVVLDAGYESCTWVPIDECIPLLDSAQHLPLGGRHVTDRFKQLVEAKHPEIQLDQGTARAIKEEHGFVALDYDTQCHKCQESSECAKSYALPDSQSLVVQQERFMAPEILFEPGLCGTACSGIGELGYDSIARSDLEYRREFYQDVILSGSGSLFPGLSDRLTEELTCRAPLDTRLRVVASPERGIGAWIGGSITASLLVYRGTALTKAEYEEGGMHAVRLKFEQPLPLPRPRPEPSIL